MKKEKKDLQELEKLLMYDAETGIIYWIVHTQWK